MRPLDLKAEARRVWDGHSCPPTTCGKITQAGNSPRFLLVAVCLTLLAPTPSVVAQRAASAHGTSHAIPHFKAPARTLASGRATSSNSSHRTHPYTSLPFPFFADTFNPDDIYSTGYPVASQPPTILLQAARALSGSEEYADNHPPSQPLVIERQNGHYIRLNSTPSNGEALPLILAPNRAQSEQARPLKLSRSNSPHTAISATAPHNLQPALLLFRDGHSEEVRDYAIANGILYARGDYYTDGY